MMSSDAVFRQKLVSIQVQLVELKKLAEDKLNACYEDSSVSEIEIAAAAMDLAQVNAAIEVLK